MDCHVLFCKFDTVLINIVQSHFINTIISIIIIVLGPKLIQPSTISNGATYR